MMQDCRPNPCLLGEMGAFTRELQDSEQTLSSNQSEGTAIGRHALVHSRQQWQSQLSWKLIVLGRCLLNVFLDVHQTLVSRLEVDLLFPHRRADVAGDVEIEVVLFDLGEQALEGALEGFRLVVVGEAAQEEEGQQCVSRASFRAMEILERKSARLCPPLDSARLAPIEVPTARAGLPRSERHPGSYPTPDTASRPAPQRQRLARQCPVVHHSLFLASKFRLISSCVIGRRLFAEHG